MNISETKPGGPSSSDPVGAKAPDGKALAAARKKRSLALAWALGAFVFLVFIVTLTRLGANVAAGAP